jgi:hypothetical protein
MSLNKNKFMLMLALVFAQSMAWGQSVALRDPTFPPQGAGLAAPHSANGVMSGAVVGRGTATAAPNVQVMLVGPSRKHVVVDGHLLKAGEQIDQWRVTHITANGVILQSAAGTQKISAYPSVKKNVVTGEAP